MIGWKIGVEIELVAPRGSSRKVLAERLAGPRGSVRPFFHPQSELSLVPDTPVFENLTLGFEARDATGELVARCVDDITLQDDLDHEAAPRDGWFRVVSDDLRLLNLVARVGRADAGPLEAVAAVAELFGTAPDVFPEGMVRVVDRNSAPIAIATPLPGERERPCEIVTPPISADHAARLDALLGPARELGFALPAEAATHIHFDREPLRDARVFRDLVRLVEQWGPALRMLVGTNPRCRRLGSWPDALRALVEAPGFAELPWPEARERLAELQLTKYCDVNVKNVVHDVPDKPTIEFRILPGYAGSAPILEGAALFEGLLRAAVEGVSLAVSGLRGLLEKLPLDDAARRIWLARV